MLYDSYPVSLEAQLADLEGDGVLVSSVSFGAETIVRVQTSPLAYGEADGDDVVLTCWTPPRYSRPSVSALAVLWVWSLVCTRCVQILQALGLLGYSLRSRSFLVDSPICRDVVGLCRLLSNWRSCRRRKRRCTEWEVLRTQAQLLQTGGFLVPERVPGHDNILLFKLPARPSMEQPADTPLTLGTTSTPQMWL
jgi:hypothetical protein